MVCGFDLFYFQVFLKVKSIFKFLSVFKCFQVKSVVEQKKTNKNHVLI